MSEFRAASERLCELHNGVRTFLFITVGELAHEKAYQFANAGSAASEAVLELAESLGIRAAVNELAEDTRKDIRTVLYSYVEKDLRDSLDARWAEGERRAKS